MSFGPGCGVSEAGHDEPDDPGVRATSDVPTSDGRVEKMRMSVFRSPLQNERADGPIGLALCGGGITGAFFEVGVLAALDDLAGASISTGFDIYVGASAGASVATPLAQGVPAERLFRALYDEADDFFPLRREHVYQVAWSKWLRVAASVGVTAFRRRVYKLIHGRKALPAELLDLGELLPAGLFDTHGYREFFSDFLKRAALSAKFGDLERQLYIVANDVDSGERVVFGEPPFHEVDIPLAVAASSAIPMFFVPVRIGERDYFDGGIGRVGNVDVLVRKGVRRVLVVNPVVPIRNEPSRVCIPSRKGHCSRIIDKGLLAVGNQALRIANKVRLYLGLKRLAAETPDLEILLVEPGEEESVLFLHSSMSMEGRHAILDYARTAARVTFKQREGEFADLLRHLSRPRQESRKGVEQAPVPLHGGGA